MKLRGVLIALVMMASLRATETPPEENSPLEMLSTLFDGVEHPPVSYLKRFRFIDIESLLEDSPDLAEQFALLSEGEKQELVDTIDEFNEALAAAIFSNDSDGNT